jgi:hypothetical protein
MLPRICLPTGRHVLRRGRPHQLWFPCVALSSAVASLSSTSRNACSTECTLSSRRTWQSSSAASVATPVDMRLRAQCRRVGGSAVSGVLLGRLLECARVGERDKPWLRPHVATTVCPALDLVPPAPPLPGCKPDPIPEKPTPAQHRNTQQNSPCAPHSNPLPAIYHPYTALSVRTVKVYRIPRL